MIQNFVKILVLSIACIFCNLDFAIIKGGIDLLNLEWIIDVFIVIEVFIVIFLLYLWYIFFTIIRNDKENQKIINTSIIIVILFFSLIGLFI